MLGRCATASVTVARAGLAAACTGAGGRKACGRELFNFSFASLVGRKKDKGDRQLFDVKWHDEYAKLGNDPQETRNAMADEDQRLRHSALWLTPLRRQVFDEIVANRSKFEQADTAAVLDGGLLFTSTMPSGLPCWMTEDSDGQKVIASADPGDLGPFFHKIVDLKLNPQQDKAALVLNLGRHPDAYTCLIKPVGLSLCFTGVMTDSISGTAADELEAVHTVQWMSDGQHVVYSRIGAAGTPAEVWLHHVGQPESSDRLLYEEEQDGFHVHVGLTSDKRFVTITALSKSSTEVHLLDSLRPDSALQLVHERQPGFMYWVAHAHGQLVIMNNGRGSYEYSISRCSIAPFDGCSASTPLGKDAWVPIIHCDVGCLEDMMLYQDYLVLSCRELGLPVLRVASLHKLAISPEGAAGKSTKGPSSEPSSAQKLAESVPVSTLQKLALPSWAMHVVSGANLAFASSTHVCHASSPVHAEEKVDLCLKSGQRINTPTDQQAEAIEAARLDGLRVCRIKVPVAADPEEQDYLEMLYRLLPQEELEDDDTVDALPKQPQLDTPFSLFLTVSLRPDAVTSPLGLSPLPVVLRAYGAYGLPADLSFCPDDLPLLDRGVVIVTAHIRGGGEHGRAWHMAATVHRKWASLYDYAAALHHLVKQGITSPGLVACDSFSAGALVAAHAMNKVPGVFAAALFRRPFVTLLNSMTDPSLPMTAHEYDEWGDPADADVVRLLASLSPHKHIHKIACVPAEWSVKCSSPFNKRYPPVLVTTGMNDTRVEWWGPVKYAWRLRAHQDSEAEILLSWGFEGHYCDHPNQVALEKTFLLMHLVPPPEESLDGTAAAA